MDVVIGLQGMNSLVGEFDTSLGSAYLMEYDRKYILRT